MNVAYPTRILLAVAASSSLGVGQMAQAITIAAAKLQPLGSVVTIENVVVSNTIDLVNSANSANFQVQDGANGITVFGSTAEIDFLLGSVAAGDRIHVTGTTTTFNGLFEIAAPLAVELVQAGVGVPAPTPTTSSDYQDFSLSAEGLESRLVSLENVQFTNIFLGQTFAGLTNYTVTDGNNIVSVRVSTNTQSLVGDVIPTGPVDLTGIFAQFDAFNPPPTVEGIGYQLLLLDDSSISLVPEPSTAVLVLLAIGGGRYARCRRDR